MLSFLHTRALSVRHPPQHPHQALLSHPGVPKLYEYEDGHILDLAAANGNVDMVNLLLEFNMTVGPSALAHAAHFNHTGVMEVGR